MRLERIDMQDRVMVKALLDIGAAGLVMSSKFVRKRGENDKVFRRVWKAVEVKIKKIGMEKTKRRRRKEKRRKEARRKGEVKKNPK